MEWLKNLLLLLLLVSSLGSSFAQSFSVTKTRDIEFGTFSVDQGGSITISNQNVRSTTGDIVLLGTSYNCAVFNITTTSSTPITIQIDQPVVDLYGPNGSTITLEYGMAFPQFPVVASGSPAVIYIGGTLYLGPKSLNPPGSYSGNVMLNFTIHNE